MMFDNLFVTGDNGFSQHTYTLAATGLKKFRGKNFSTRCEATEAMYRELGKQNLSINKIYDDKHYKTYICSKGVVFYINRV